jgi:methylglyoxal synthase/DNA-binding transcriptional regulator LsrR (DeoR family)
MPENAVEALENPVACEKKPILLLMASRGAREDVSSPLLRFVRDYANVLKKFEIHATGGTADSIVATGFYNRDIDVIPHRSGPRGGVVELAAMVARGQSRVVIFFSDTSDLNSDAPENHAVQRVCKALKVRLITTQASAEQWAEHEFDKYLALPRSDADGFWMPGVWKKGNRNIEHKGELIKIISLSLEKQTLALIAHDEKKGEMASFVQRHIAFLSRFHRILTTGTTGYLLIHLFGDETQWSKIEKEKGYKNLGPDRRKKIYEQSQILREKLKLKPNRSAKNFAKKIIPLFSGPSGGDILIADEVLRHKCHAVVFFQDPGTAQPHGPDIHLFERTCQLWSEGVYATCIADAESAKVWADSLQKKIRRAVSPRTHVAHDLLGKYKLNDVVIIDFDEKGTESHPDKKNLLGKALARACAGYFHQRLNTLGSDGKEIRIGVSWGYIVKEVLDQLKEMKESKLLPETVKPSGPLIWSPLIGNITTEYTDREAAVLADEYNNFYSDAFDKSGKVETFRSSGFLRGAHDFPKSDLELIKKLEQANLILVSAARWDDEASLRRISALRKEHFPQPMKDAIGTMSAVFLKANGEPAKENPSHYRKVGLGYSGFQAAAKKGSVILVCGGLDRHEVARAALLGRLVSVLITTRQTAEAIRAE